MSRDQIITEVYLRALQYTRGVYPSWVGQAAPDAVGEALCTWLRLQPDLSRSTKYHGYFVGRRASEMLNVSSRRIAGRHVRMLVGNERAYQGSSEPPGQNRREDAVIAAIDSYYAEVAIEASQTIEEPEWPDTWREALAVLRRMKWSQARIAAEIGVSEEAVRKWLSGAYEPSLSRHIAIMSAATDALLAARESSTKQSKAEE
jgi:DNA-binding XRE family transcriptional regulator